MSLNDNDDFIMMTEGEKEKRAKRQGEVGARHDQEKFMASQARVLSSKDGKAVR